MLKKISYNFGVVMVVLAGFLSMLPIIFIVSNSFMGAGEATARYTSMVIPTNFSGIVDGSMHYVDIAFLPQFITGSGWYNAFVQTPANLRFIWNSLLLTIPIVLGQLVIAPLAAYGFERVRSKNKDKLYFAYIITMLLPMQALLVPHFIMANFFGINGNYLAIILPAIFAPFGVFLVRQQLKNFDPIIIEAAKVDGGRELWIFIKIVLPNIKPALTALAVLAFAEAYSIVDQAVVFISDPYMMPMSVHLSTSLTDNIGVVFALSTLFMIPALIIFIYGQENLSKTIGGN